jgi:hypothetical protein
MVNPIELVAELQTLEEKLVSGSGAADTELIHTAQKRNEVVELLIAYKVLSGFYNDRLESILKTDPGAAKLCQEYTEYQHVDMEGNNSRGSTNSRLALIKGRISSADGSSGSGGD